LTDKLLFDRLADNDDKIGGCQIQRLDAHREWLILQCLPPISGYPNFRTIKFKDKRDTVALCKLQPRIVI